MKITFQKKKKKVETINAAGKKTGLKEVDQWLDNPQTDHQSDWIFRVEVEPLELTLNGEKKKNEVIDFFVNANTGLEFYLKHVWSDNHRNFELQWNGEDAEGNIGFSETRPNTLVAFSNFLYFDNLDNNQNQQDLEINWENISLIDGGLIFFLTSPQSISLNHRNYTYDKVFWSPSFCTPKDYDFIKQRLTERKADKKPLIIKTILSFDAWLSVKDNGNLYILGKKGQERSTDLSYDFLREVPFIASDIAGWLKLPFHQREKFIERYWQNDEPIENMKREIKNALQNLASNNDNEPKQDQNNPVGDNKVGMNKGLKIFFWTGGIVFGLLLICLVFQKVLKKLSKK